MRQGAKLRTILNPKIWVSKIYSDFPNPCKNIGFPSVFGCPGNSNFAACCIQLYFLKAAWQNWGKLDIKLEFCHMSTKHWLQCCETIKCRWCSKVQVRYKGTFMLCTCALPVINLLFKAPPALSSLTLHGMVNYHIIAQGKMFWAFLPLNLNSTQMTVVNSHTFAVTIFDWCIFSSSDKEASLFLISFLRTCFAARSAILLCFDRCCCLCWL